MTYKINGTEISIQPTTGKWLPREVIEYDGNGHPIYSALREYEIRWNQIDDSTVYQLQTFFGSVNNTGSVVVDLPRYGSATYQFYAYTGCVLNEPEFGRYFVEHNMDVILLVRRIRT